MRQGAAEGRLGGRQATLGNTAKKLHIKIAEASALVALSKIQSYERGRGHRGSRREKGRGVVRWHTC